MYKMSAYTIRSWDNPFMRYRKLSDTGDMTFGNGELDYYIDVPEAPAQAVGTRLNLWAGEWFLNTSDGTNYQDTSLGTGKSETIEPEITERILDTEGVSSIESFDLISVSENRSVEIRAVINTEFGSVQITGIQ